MRRFNLLLVNTSEGTGHKLLKSVSKVFRRNFVFEVRDLEEADSILRKLQIDLLIADMDGLDVDMASLNERFPNLIIMGIAEQPAILDTRIDPLRQRIFSKRDFHSGIVEELKSIRRKSPAQANSVPARKAQRPAAATDFKDFVQLVAMN